MQTFLVLSPFGAFAMLMLMAPPAIALFTAAILATAVIGYDLYRGKSVKIFMTASTLLFGALGAYDILSHGNWSPVAVRVAVDGGVLAIALVSIAIRVPFTLQYAREKVDAEIRQMPGFIRANYVTTWFWTGALVLMLIADILTVYAPSLPLWVGVAIAFAARNGAVYFSKWYPQYRRAKDMARNTVRNTARAASTPLAHS
jgi:hypothetical protein